MLIAGRVSQLKLREIARQAESSEPTYAEIGATLGATFPSGYRHDRYERVVGTGATAFDRAVEGMHRWVAHTGAGLTVAPEQPPELGMTVALAAPIGPLTAVAICRVVQTLDEPDCFGFAYGTLPGHPERGEEAFVVRLGIDHVTFHIAAFSRPAEPLARLGGPVTRRIQQATTHRYLDALCAFVAG